MKVLVNLIPEDVGCSLCIANLLQEARWLGRPPHGDLPWDLLLHARESSHVAAALSLELHIPEGRGSAFPVAAPTELTDSGSSGKSL